MHGLVGVGQTTFMMMVTLSVNSSKFFPMCHCDASHKSLMTEDAVIMPISQITEVILHDFM